MLKKIISIITIFAIAIFALQMNSYAASVPLNSVTVDVSKEKIAPGEEVKVTINFGTPLGAYTFDVAYDNHIFDFVSAEGGTENDNGTRVRVTYYDATGGSNPRENMSVTFRAKADIVSTNPTDFSVTAEGLANNDASQQYDDITTPITKNVTVEPNYVDYSLRLNYTGTVTAEEEKAMELITESSMGRNYDHVKMNVEITQKPSDNATVKLLATERTRQEIDLVQQGWGEPDGYALGGKDVAQILDIRGLFSESGDYKIKISLVDKDNSDSLIVEKEFDVAVTQATIGDENTGDGNNGNNGNTGAGDNNVGGGTQNPDNNPPTENGDNTTQTPGDNNGEQEIDENGNPITNGNTPKDENTTNEQEVPETLPQTGNTVYASALVVISVLVASYVVVANLKRKN